MTILEHEIVIEFIELPPLGQLERDWIELENRSDSSFFTSWSWIGCWLTCLPAELQPKLLRATVGDTVVGMGLLTARNELRHHLIPVKSLNLHATGDVFYDSIFIEYNGFLADRDFQPLVVPRMLEHLVLQSVDWEELLLDGITETTRLMLPCLKNLQVRKQQRIYRYIDLNNVREAGGDYLSLLGHNTRYNIRRSIKEFAKQGPVTLTVAKNLDECLVFLGDLKQKHQAYWQSRELPGAFANSFFEAFHERLIRARFDHGEVQLIRVSAGERPIGYLYNIVHRGLVHNYQSGFEYTICKRQYSPGLVSHTLAIEYNASQGHRIYDLMAGDSQYKQSLKTHSGEMEWVVIQRGLLKFRVEDGLRKTKRRLKSVLSITCRNRQTGNSVDTSL